MTNIPLSSIAPSAPPQAPSAPPAPAPAAPAAPAAPPRVAPNLLATPPAPPPPQAPPVAPTPPPQVKIKWRGQEMAIDQTEAARLAQIGMSAENLQQQRAEFEARRREMDDLVKAGQLVAGVAQTDPTRFQMIRSLMAGRLDETAAMLSRAGVRGQPPQPQGGASELDDPLTPQAPTPSIPFEVEQRIAHLEATINRQQAALQQRSVNEGIESAIARHEFLRGDGSVRRSRRLQQRGPDRRAADESPGCEPTGGGAACPRSATRAVSRAGWSRSGGYAPLGWKRSVVRSAQVGQGP